MQISFHNKKLWTSSVFLYCACKPMDHLLHLWKQSWTWLPRGSSPSPCACPSPSASAGCCWYSRLAISEADIQDFNLPIFSHWSSTSSTTRNNSSSTWRASSLSKLFSSHHFFFGGFVEPGFGSVRVSFLSEVEVGPESEVPLGKPHWKRRRVYLGIAQIAIATPPPPFTQTGTLGHFISGPTWANAIWTSIFTA